MSSPVAVVTGANRGLGLECVKQLTEKGYRVVLTGRTETRAIAAAHGLNKALGANTIEPHPLEVTSEHSANTLAEHLTARYGRVDVLINNAGSIFDDSVRSGILDCSPQVLMRTFENNTVGAFIVTKALASLLMKARGNVVNVSSGMGGLAQMGSGFAGYRLSKAGISALTRIFHAELHERGVTINAVCPGWVQTDLGGPNATRDVESGARGIVWAATLPPDGPSGGFFRDGAPIPW